MYRPVAFGLNFLGNMPKLLSTTYQRLVSKENENPLISFITNNIQNITMNNLQNENQALKNNKMQMEYQFNQYKQQFS